MRGIIARSRRVDPIPHARAQPELDRLGTCLGNQSLKEYDLVAGSVPSVAARAIHGDVAAHHAAEHVAERLACDLAQQIENGEFQARDRNPERQSLPLVVGIGNVDALDQALEVPGILAGEERRDLARQDRPRRLEHIGMSDRDAGRAVTRSHAHQELLAGLQYLD